jgi:SAM-dependent methyltransferase
MSIDYGTDAPVTLRNLALAGVAGLALGLVGTALPRAHPLSRLRTASLSAGIGFSLAAGLMVVYARVGKFRHRDRMLAMLPLRGDEHILDVGTGRGLLAVAAARGLTGGRVVAIDIWNAEDLSDNRRARTEEVLRLEGVSDRVTLEEADAERLPFADGSFDAVVSNLCIHNIYNAPGRHEAIGEIVRVLRPGGRAVISDYRHTSDYARYFREYGMTAVEERGPYLWDVFPPLSIVVATKPTAS